MGPNDSDPPDYVTGDTEENALLEDVYEKFPWLPGLGERAGELYKKRPLGWHHLGSRPMFLDTGSTTVGPLAVEAMLQFVINEAVQRGQRNAEQGVGEYIDVQAADLLHANYDLHEAQNILAIQKEIRRLLSEQIDRLSGCIRMVLDAANSKAPITDSEIVEAIDWDRLEEVAKQSSAPPIGRKE
jgi:hypothetical protein